MMNDAARSDDSARSDRLLTTVEITTKLRLPTLHRSQAAAYWALRSHRFKALRCGRRWGKTDFAKVWLGDGLARGWPCAWFAPQHKTWSEAYTEMADLFEPMWEGGSKGGQIMRMMTGGRIDFWTLENAIAGRGRHYRRIVIDEAAFAKDGDNKSEGSMMEMWEKSIKPTLFDYQGEALVCSNSAGKKSDNFFYNICTDPQYGFAEYHARTVDNDRLPKRLRGQSPAAWLKAREQALDDIRTQNDPLVYAQEYEAEFVDWAGVAFFAEASLLEPSGRPAAHPIVCDSVFAVIDTAIKTGVEHDGTAVMFFARCSFGSYPLLVLDWDIKQIEGGSLENWLPSIYQRLEELAEECRARHGSMGVWIEDKGSGTILLQQARRREWLATGIESVLTAMGKDERAISVSGYVYRGEVKFTQHAYDKTAVYKRHSRNHALEQITSFRVGDKDAKEREDDLLDTFTYGIAIGLGNKEGF